jgi:FkbM family methyltransferase
MQKFIKYFGKKIVKYFPIALTKNEYYDRLTKRVIQLVVKNNCTAIDIGCNEGKILQMLIQVATVKPIAFEPIPSLYNALQAKFENEAVIHNIALSNKIGEEQFSLVQSNMAFSSFKQHSYATNLNATTITVKTNTLDNIAPTINEKIALIKIDVEGAELLVLNGAIETIVKQKPIILFEFGKKGADPFGYNEKDIYHFFTKMVQYKIFTLSAWLNKSNALTAQEFTRHYNMDTEYFFLAEAI